MLTKHMNEQMVVKEKDLLRASKLYNPILPLLVGLSTVQQEMSLLNPIQELSLKENLKKNKNICLKLINRFNFIYLFKLILFVLT